MIACRICGERKGKKGFSDKDRDQRLCWCKKCAEMYEGMKAEKRLAEWDEAEKKAIGLLKLTRATPFVVSFK